MFSLVTKLNLEYKKEYPLDKVVRVTAKNIMENGLSNDNYCLYVKEKNAIASPNLGCYLENYPTITDDDEEVYPEFVTSNSLELFYYGQQFEDVIYNIISQKGDKSTIEDFMKGLNYFSKNDDFIDL